MSRTETVPTTRIDIFIAGEPSAARQICRAFCFERGLCVTIETCDFIYTGGAEFGVRVGLINYPRFPSSAEQLMETALALAERLKVGLCQHSFSVAGPAETVWVSDREDAA